MDYGILFITICSYLLLCDVLKLLVSPGGGEKHNFDFLYVCTYDEIDNKVDFELWLWILL